MATEENQNEENKVVYDPMISSFYEDNQNQEEQNQEETEEEKQAKALLEEEAAKKEADDLAAETERLRLEQEEKDKLVLSTENNNQEQPKWDANLNDQSKYLLDKLSKGEDKEVFELLKNKYGYSSLTDDEKIFEYMAQKHPHLDKDDLSFKLAQEYGIGATELAEEDMTEAIRTNLKRQEIERKGLLNEAKKFFDDKASSVEIPALPSILDLDEDYKAYKESKVEQAKQLEEQKKQEEELNKEIEQTITKINTTAQGIEALPIEIKIELDQGEFDLKSDFKLDEAKRKQLADYAIEYTPTKSEIEAHTKNGEFDMKGYMTMLAQRQFSAQIQKAVLKQAIAKDRETFTEQQLKNSTLRNNSDRAVVEVPEDFESAAMRA